MRRTRWDIRSPHKLVADVADRAQTLGMAGVVLDLLANPTHVDVDRALVADERVVPELLEQLLAAKDLAGVLHQEMEQREGAWFERECVLAAAGYVGGGIEEEVTGGERWRRPNHACPAGANQRTPQGGGDPGQQLAHPERLGNVVIRA